MDQKRNEIYLAALLHDIGKFYQRADEKGLAGSRFISPEIHNLEDVLCPLYKGKASHKHVIWTAQFFKDFESHLKPLISSASSMSYDSILRAAAAHHSPRKSALHEIIIQKGDHYSSGADRSIIDDSWKDAEEEDDTRWDSFRRIKMRSIFEGISLTESNDLPWSASYDYKLPLCSLTLTENFFPRKSDDSVPDYLSLWNQFITEVKFIQTNSFRTFSETMLALLKKYTCHIPSSTMHLPDVSLYDHLKTTAAFSACLYDYITENGLDKLPPLNEKTFLLIGGDLSGIQKFIYSIIARGAAKNLKGRSFYLQLLVDNILMVLVDELRLFDANIIYSSGGGFYLLAPNTDRVKSKLSDLSKKLSEKLFSKHNADLFLALAYVPFGEEEIFFDRLDKNRRTIGDVWAELAVKLGEEKKRRFSHLITSKPGVFFNPGESGGIKSRDSITGNEITGKEIDLDGHPIDEYTFMQIKLGERLRNVDYWVISKEKLDYFPPEAVSFNPIDIGIYNYFVPRSFFASDDNRNKLKKSADKIRAISVNDMKFLESPQKGIDNIYGFDFYGGNKFPVSQWGEKPKLFEELAGVIFEDEDRTKRKTSPGLVRLGVLRMDVDNLGAIFKRGLSPDKRSFSRYSVLSRSLDYFFKGYINAIWQKEKYRGHTQVIYSGGDDLFLIGKWDILLCMAAEINEEFRNWTCHNPDLTLSGGIAIVYPKFPVLKASGQSEQEELNAKTHFYGDRYKDAFSLFGYAFNWELEYQYLFSLKNKIKSLMQEEEMPQGLATDMYNLMQQACFRYDYQENAFSLSNYQVIWLSAYSFKRAMQRTKNETIIGFYKEWISRIYTGRVETLPYTKYHSLQYLAVASKWAAMELR
jgi:CRISPR-associated protein Csm1